jgi:hypothetical protein
MHRRTGLCNAARFGELGEARFDTAQRTRPGFRD